MNKEKLHSSECSFCHIPRKNLEFLVASEEAAICEECVKLAQECLAEERAKKLAAKARHEMEVELTDAEGKPRTVKMVELREGERIVSDKTEVIDKLLKDIENKFMNQL